MVDDSLIRKCLREGVIFEKVSNDFTEESSLLLVFLILVVHDLKERMLDLGSLCEMRSMIIFLLVISLLVMMMVTFVIVFVFSFTMRRSESPIGRSEERDVVLCE